jgi:TetR/AcrR family transcriptional regulator, cholesterol catabolism regulator
MSAETAPPPGNIRDDVARAALAVFLANGYDRATVREIAERAGLKVSSLYAHIGSKEELFKTLVRPVLAVGTEWIESVADADLPADQKLRLGCARAGELYDLHPEVAIYLSSYSAEIGEVAPDLAVRAKTAWRKVVAECLADRAYEPAEIIILTYGILGMLSWLHRWYRPGGSWTGREIGASYGELLLDGLRRGAPRSERPAPPRSFEPEPSDAGEV